MEVFFNELSCKPLAASQGIAKDKIITLLSTLKELRKDGFNIMRTKENFYDIELVTGYSVSQFLNDPLVNRDLKILFKGVVKKPYIEDPESYEAEVFILSDFQTTDVTGELVSPEGLASAYVFNSPSISLTGSEHWERESFPLSIISNADHEPPLTINIPNVYSAQSVGTDFFKAWLKSLIDGIQLDSEENILKVFPPENFSFDARAIREIIFWYYDDKRYLTKVKNLLNDIVNNPFKGGIGHTEPLAGTEGKASKRIIKKDRIVYTYKKGKITIHQCRGHYNDN